MEPGGRRAACTLMVAVLLAACAARVPVAPATLTPLAAAAPDIVVAAKVPIHLTTGYERVLASGSRWRAVGSLPQGTVYRPIGTVFAIEGRDVHEAYLVVRGDSLQGFFLPAEDRYSALPSPVAIPLQPGAQQ